MGLPAHRLLVRVGVCHLLFVCLIDDLQRPLLLLFKHKDEIFLHWPNPEPSKVVLYVFHNQLISFSIHGT